MLNIMSLEKCTLKPPYGPHALVNMLPKIINYIKQEKAFKCKNDRLNQSRETDWNNGYKWRLNWSEVKGSKSID